MHCDTTQHTTNPARSDSVIQASEVPGLLHITALRRNRLKCSVEDKRKHEPTVQISHKEILTAEWRAFVSGTALAREINVCGHSFPLPLIAHEFIHHSTQISQHCQETQISLQKPNIITKTKYHYEIET